jgi:hypothetical protein
MNFLFFPGGSYVGGMEIVIQSLMGQLNAMGHPTLAIVSGWNDGDYPTRLEASDLSFEEVKLGRFYRSQPLWTLDTMRNLPAAALRLRQVVRAFRPDAAIYPDSPAFADRLCHSAHDAQHPLPSQRRREPASVADLARDQRPAASHRLRIAFCGGRSPQRGFRTGKGCRRAQRHHASSRSASSPQQSVDMPGNRRAGSAAQATPAAYQGA